jgi:hypothetical protein
MNRAKEGRERRKLLYMYASFHPRLVLNPLVG